MPNLVGPIIADILAQHPTATLAERLDRGLQMRLADAPDGRQRYALVCTIGPLHYRDGAALLEIDTDYRDSDDANFSDLADRTPYRLYAGTNGQRRLYPRRDVLSEYIEFDRPQYWTGSAWQNLNAGPRTRAGDTLSWDRPAFSMALSADAGGIHKTITLKTLQAARRIRWPVTLVGLTWDNWTLVSVADGTVVGRLSQPLITADGNGELETPRTVGASYVNGAVEFTADITGLVYPITIDPTVDVQVAVNGDDGNWQSTGGFSTSQNNNQIGNVTPPGFTSNSFARFTGVTISGTIDTSYVEVMASATGSVAVAIIIYADDEDNPAAPTSNADVAGRARTTASASWSPGAWTTGTFYPSPSLNTIFQELVDSYTISADAVMVFLQDDASGSNLNRSIRDFTIGAASSPKLHIEYTAAGGLTRTATPITGALSGIFTRTASSVTAAIQYIATRTATPVTAALAGTFSRTATPITTTLSGIFTRTATPVTAALSGAFTRTASSVTATLSGVLTRTATPVTSALQGTFTRIATSVSASLGAGLTRTATPITAALSGVFTRTATSVTAALQGTSTRTATTVTAALAFVSTRIATPITAALAATTTRTATTITAALSGSFTRSATAVTAALAGTFTRTATTVTASLTSQLTRTASSITAALSGSFTRTASSVTAALSGSFTRTASSVTASLATTLTRTASSVTASLAITLTRTASTVTAALQGTLTRTASTITAALTATRIRTASTVTASLSAAAITVDVALSATRNITIAFSAAHNVNVSLSTAHNINVTLSAS